MPVTTTVSSGRCAGPQLSLTISHTSDTNPLYVLLSWWVQGGGIDTRSLVTGITFNGVALTRLQQLAVSGNTHEVWWLDTPAAVTANTVLTLLASGNSADGSSGLRVAAGVINLSGWPTDVTQLRYHASTGSYPSAQPSNAVASSIAAEVVDWVGWNQNTRALAASGGQTSLWNQAGAGGSPVNLFYNQQSAGSLKAGAAGSVTTSWTFSGGSGASDQWGLAAMSFADPIPSVNPIPLNPPSSVPYCAPQTVVSNGGKGKSGCNVGGIGGGHEYDLADGVGSVPDHPDPDDGEVLTGAIGASGLEPWIELVHEAYPPTSPSVTVYRRAFEELADADTYEGGRKEAGVLVIGEIEHGLGNNQGGFEAGTADLQFSDIRDRLFRDLAADQELDGDEYRIKLASDAARAAGTVPRVLQRGIVEQATLQSTLQAQLSGVDWLFSDFGPFGPGRNDPNWTFGDIGDAAPGMTTDTKAQVIPLLYGEKSDEGATNPAGGSGVFAKGLLPGYFLGLFDLTGLVDAPPDTTGRSLAEVVALLQASVTAGTTVADWSGIIGVADAINLEAMGTVPSTYTGLANVIGYGDLDALLAGGTTPPPAQTEWGFIATGLGPWFQYTGVYGSDLGCGDPMQTHDRIELDPASRSDILVPGINFPYPVPYLELTNPTTGRTFWLTGVFVMGPLLDDHLNGVVTLAFNAIGIEDVGDGSGLPIMRVEDMKQHRLENHWINQWSSGPYATNSVYPQFEDGVAMVRSSSFLTRQNFFKTQFGSPSEGILVSEYADTSQSNLDIVKQWNSDTESRLGVNQHGQIMDWGFDPTVDTSLWPRIDHVRDLFGPLVRTSGDERENVVSGSCDWDADFDKTRAGPFTYQSDAGIAKYKGRIRQGAAIVSHILNDTEHFQWVLQQRLTRLQFGMTIIQVTVPIDPWLNYDVGEGVLLNSEDGPGPEGYVDQPCIILRRKISVQSRLMTFTLWDVSTLLTGSP